MSDSERRPVRPSSLMVERGAKMRIDGITVKPFGRTEVFVSVKAYADNGEVIIGNSGAVNRSEVSDVCTYLIGKLASTQAHYSMRDANEHKTGK